MSMNRVSRKTPCPICEKPDWCLIASDGSAAICQRIRSDHSVSEAGWLHRLADDWVPSESSRRQFVRPKLVRDWQGLTEKYQANMTIDAYESLGKDLGLSSDVLQQFGVGWDQSKQVFTFPMRNSLGEVVGIRTRLLDGTKEAIFGGDGNGLFYVPGSLGGDSLIVCEGATDAPALFDCGYESVIGRPSCRLGTRYIIEVIRLIQPAVLLLIPDRDERGLSGFAELAAAIANQRAIAFARIDSITPPVGVKDVREWKQKKRDHLTGTITAKIESIRRRTEGTTNDER